MRRTLAILGVLAVAALTYCAKHIEQLAPFPCAVDGSCPGNYSCVPGVGCRMTQPGDPCGGPTHTSCGLGNAVCSFGTCAQMCNAVGGVNGFIPCPSGYRCAASKAGGQPGCFLDCTTASCPAHMTCAATNLQTDAGAERICVWTAPSGDAGVALYTPPDLSLNFHPPFGFDMAIGVLARPTLVAQSARGALSSDGTTIVWDAGTSWDFNLSALMRLGPSDMTPFQITTNSQPFKATTIYGSSVYFTSATNIVGSAPLAGGSISTLVSNQTIQTTTLNSFDFNFIQTDGTTLFWSTQSDPATASGTIASAPIGGGSATVLANMVGQPSGLLRAGGSTFYSALGTSSKNYADGTLTAVGGVPLDSGSAIGDVQPLDAMGTLVYIKGGAILKVKPGGVPQAIYTPTDSTCQSSVCATRLAVANGNVYYIGALGANNSLIVFAAPYTPIVTATATGQNFAGGTYGGIVVANGTLYWIAEGNLYSHPAP